MGIEPGTLASVAMPMPYRFDNDPILMIVSVFSFSSIRFFLSQRSSSKGDLRTYSCPRTQSCRRAYGTGSPGRWSRPPAPLRHWPAGRTQRARVLQEEEQQVGPWLGELGSAGIVIDSMILNPFWLFVIVQRFYSNFYSGSSYDCSRCSLDIEQVAHGLLWQKYCKIWREYAKTDNMTKMMLNNYANN